MIFWVVPILLLVSMVLVGRQLLDFPFLAKQILLSLVQSSVQPRKRWPWTPLDDEQANYAEEKAEVKAELERLASLPSTERLSGYRKLAKKWHPDKHPYNRKVQLWCSW